MQDRISGGTGRGHHLLSASGCVCTCLHAGDLSLIPGSGRSSGEGIGYSLQYSWFSLVAQLVKNPPATWETWVQSLGWEDLLEKGKATHCNILAWRIPGTVRSSSVQFIRSVVSDSLQPYGPQAARLLCPWGFSRQEYWSGLPCPSPGDFPNPGIEPRSPTLQVDSLLSEPPGKPKNTGVSSLSLLQGIFPTQELNWGLLHCRWILYHLRHQGSPIF